MKVIRRETVTFSGGDRKPVEQTAEASAKGLTRLRRAHYRLSWQERLARNALPSDAPRLSVTLHGLPPTFAASFGFALQVAA